MKSLRTREIKIRLTEVEHAALQLRSKGHPVAVWLRVTALGEEPLKVRRQLPRRSASPEAAQVAHQCALAANALLTIGDDLIAQHGTADALSRLQESLARIELQLKECLEAAKC